jgi:tetratricopeptide (TPR) repeat protein
VGKNPGTAHYRRELATSYESTGNLLTLRDIAQARTQYEQCELLRRQLVDENPTDLQLKRALASVRYNLGQVAPSIEESLRLHESARELRKEVLDKLSDHAECRAELGASLQCLGGLLYQAGKIEEASSIMAEAGDHFREALARAPKVKAYTSLLVIYYQDLAALQAQTGKTDEAIETLSLAIALADPAQLAPLRFRRADVHARMGRHAASTAEVAELLTLVKFTPADTYNAACIFALAAASALKDPQLSEPEREDHAEKHALRAIELLEQAVAAGYDDFEHMQKDADLKSLQTRPDFKRLSKQE